MMIKLFITVLLVSTTVIIIPTTFADSVPKDIKVCSLQSHPNYSAYCNCDSDNEMEVEVLKCSFWGNPQNSRELWSAMSKLKNVSYLEITPRPERSLQVIPSPSMFRAMRKLTYFSIKYSQLQKIPSFAFGNSSSLSELILRDNMISELGTKSFTALRNVSKITLSVNHLTEINRHVFTKLPKLQGLYLDRNWIQVVHDKAFYELENLEELDLQRNNLTVIAREVFSGLKKVVRLDLQGNAIEYLGDHVFADMPLLHELDLHDNQIRSISSTAFFNLRLLGRLDLHGNKIVSLEPPTFTPIPMLYSLDLRDNQLETLSETLIEPIYENFKNGSFQLKINGNRFNCNCQILWILKLYTETESEYVKTELGRLDCNMFHTPSEQKHQRHLYTANITLEKVSPEETTPFAFDGIKKVIKLDPDDFECHHSQQKDLASVPQSDGGNIRSSDESSDGGGGGDNVSTSLDISLDDKKDLQQSHHQSHVDTTRKTIPSSSGATTFSSSIILILPSLFLFGRVNLP